MKIGYPCINRSLESSSCKTFRLASYSEERLADTIKNNLEGLRDILHFNIAHELMFFRITSDLIPFASHPVNQFPWQERFKSIFASLGDLIYLNKIRISVHPDQFVLINSLNENVFHNSIRELEYHAEVLDLLDLNSTHKIQIHVGGIYGDKNQSIQRFIARFKTLPEKIRSRLCIENDDRLFTVADCYRIYEETGMPIIFDNFHHHLNNEGETTIFAAQKAFSTWHKDTDGIPMIDYSSQEVVEKARTGKHSTTIDIDDFERFLQEMSDFDFDIMLEIKDKEVSALKAMKIFKEMNK